MVFFPAEVASPCALRVRGFGEHRIFGFAPLQGTQQAPSLHEQYCGMP